MKIGATTINSCKIGSNQVNEVRIGSTLIWSYSSFDPDAQLFITNAAITDTTQQNAVNNLVIGLKTDGLWDKMKAIYPFIGNTASSTSYNLKDTSQFQIVWNGGVIHSNLGVLPNGTNGYGNTNFNYITQGMSANSHHVGIYINNDNNLGIDFGADAGVSNFYLSAKASILSNNARFQTETTDQAADADSLGYYIGNRQNATTRKLLKNNNLLASRVFTLSEPFQNLNATIGALNRNGTPSFYTNKRYCFLNLGYGLTDTEASNLYLRVQAFQTTLSRNV